MMNRSRSAEWISRESLELKTNDVAKQLRTCFKFSGIHIPSQRNLVIVSCKMNTQLKLGIYCTVNLKLLRNFMRHKATSEVKLVVQ